MTRLPAHRDARRGHRRATGGFTLIELLVTIIVFSILLGLAVPAARSEAIKNDTTSAAIAGGGGAQICTSNDGAACTGTPWNQGWIVLGIDPANPQRGAKRLQVVGAL